ncbi:hypothetical protein [Catellatospora sp. NPDC049609]|uniref:hypothetical protein n=1 Tax=Catellatospora sp. NPDC049609 TaxID=3155505 RepID=UPI0034431FFA
MELETFDVSMLGYLVPQLVGAVPFLIGLILALAMRARIGPLAAGLTLAACALGLLGVIINAWWGLWGIRAAVEGGSPQTTIVVVNLVLGLIHLAWLSLLVGAVFAGRRQLPVVRTAVPAPDSPL